MPAKTEKDAAAIAFAKDLHNIPWCDDYEKMISGVLYNSLAPELVQGRFRARKLMNKYNTHFPDDATPESLEADRTAVLKQMMGHVGSNAYIEPNIYVDYGCNIFIGDNFYSNFNLTMLDCGIIRIGDRCQFGPNISIYGATHETGVQSRRDYIEYAGPVTIGNDCWIGGNVSIMPGVTIGKGCTIAAGSIVTKDIDEFSVAMGQPCKVVKKVNPVPDL